MGEAGVNERAELIGYLRQAQKLQSERSRRLGVKVWLLLVAAAGVVWWLFPQFEALQREPTAASLHWSVGAGIHWYFGILVLRSLYKDIRTASRGNSGEPRYFSFQRVKPSRIFYFSVFIIGPAAASWLVFDGPVVWNALIVLVAIALIGLSFWLPHRFANKLPSPWMVVKPQRFAATAGSVIGGAIVPTIWLWTTLVWLPTHWVLDGEILKFQAAIAVLLLLAESLHRALDVEDKLMWFAALELDLVILNRSHASVREELEREIVGARLSEALNAKFKSLEEELDRLSTEKDRLADQVPAVMEIPFEYKSERQARFTEIVSTLVSDLDGALETSSELISYLEKLSGRANMVGDSRMQDLVDNQVKRARTLQTGQGTIVTWLKEKLAQLAKDSDSPNRDSPSVERNSAAIVADTNEPMQTGLGPAKNS